MNHVLRTWFIYFLLASQITVRHPVKFFAPFLLLLIASALSAAEKMPEACRGDDSGSSVSLNICVAAIYEETDKKLNRLFADVLTDAKRHTSASKVRAALLSAQRTWLNDDPAAIMKQYFFFPAITAKSQEACVCVHA